MNRKISKSVCKGTVIVPPSKSYAHRYIICAALADGESHIKNIDLCQDILATLDCIKALGADYSIDGTTLTVKGVAGKITSNVGTKPAIFPCRESGSTLRFMIPISLTSENNVEFRGTDRLLERGIYAYEAAFAYSEINYRPTKTKLCMNGSIRPGSYRIRGSISSQYISGLLFALPLLSGDSKLFILPPVESSCYIEMTLDVLKMFGIKIKEIGRDAYYIEGGQVYNPCDVTVEGDWSNAAFFCALNYLDEENNVLVKGLSARSQQGDKAIVDYLDAVTSGASIVNLENNPDLAPILFAFAAYKSGGTFIGTKRLITKESNRAKAMKEELKKFGAKIDINQNSVVIHDTVLHAPTKPLEGHNDHRIVMALSILLSIFGGEITDSESVNKSYPNFFKELERIKIDKLT